MKQQLSESAWERVSYLFRSRHRYRILDSTPKEYSDEKHIASLVEASRPTVHRTLTKFNKFDWVDRSQTQFKKTRTGDWVSDQVSEFANAIFCADNLRPLFEIAEGCGVPLTSGDTAELNLTLPTDREPNRPATEFRSTLRRDFTNISIYLGAVTKAIEEEITRIADGAEAAVLVPELKTGQIQPSLSDYRIVPRPHTGGLSLSLGVLDEDQAVLFVQNSSSYPVAYATTESRPFVNRCSTILAALQPCPN